MSALDSVIYEAMIGDGRNNYRKSHLLQFFESDVESVGSATRYALSGLIKGEGVLIIATRSHLEGIKKELTRLEIKVNECVDSGQFVMLDAHETLRALMNGASPDWLRFQQTVAKLMKEMNSKFKLVRAYSEMVDVLTGQGNLDGAMMFEALWNELNRSLPFSLLCGYSTANFKDASGGVNATRVCSCHSHTVNLDRSIALKLTR